MPVVKPIRKGAKLANTTELTAEAAEDIRAGDAITVEYSFGETLLHTFGTMSMVYCAAYSPDGQRLLVGTGEYTLDGYSYSEYRVTVYSTEDYSEITHFVVEGVPYEIAFKPNSSQVAILLNGSYDPTGAYYSGGAHATVCIYDTNTFELLWWYDLGQTSSGTRSLIKYSSTGRYFLTCNYYSKELKVFTTGTPPYTEASAPVGYQVSDPRVCGAVYNHDDSVLALAYDGYVGLYDNTGDYPREVAFSSRAPSNSHWSVLEYSKDESRLYLAKQSVNSGAYVYAYEVTKDSIAVLKHGSNYYVHYNMNGSVCAVTPDSYRIMTATTTGFGRWKPHQVYDASAALPTVVDVPELPEPYMTTDMISYLLFKPNGDSFVFFGCTEDDSSAPGTAYVYSCKKLIKKATLNRSKQAVGVGFTQSSLKAGEVGTVSLFY